MRTAPFEPSFAGRVDDRRAVQLEQDARRSGVALDGMTHVSFSPFSFATSAREMPVLPLVGSSSSCAGIEIGGLDHRERDAVLDRAGRVLALELRVDRAARRRQRLELDQRGVPDQVEQ